jgi:hypothetical protein
MSLVSSALRAGHASGNAPAYASQLSCASGAVSNSGMQRPAIFANGDFYLDKDCFLKVKIATYLLQLDKMLNNGKVALLAV